MTELQSRTPAIAGRVRTLRTARGLSGEQLAGAMRERGIAWKQATVTNLEKSSGNSRARNNVPGRTTVTVDELLALADVFAVPPMSLLDGPGCATCADVVPAGFTCNDCGKGA